MAATSTSEIKVVGKSGQISLGKRYAGKILELQRLDDGTLLLRAVAMVPESQLWTLQEPHRSRIAKGLAWAAETSRASRTRATPSERRESAGAVRVAAGSSHVRLDLNSPEFQDVFFRLEPAELKQVVASLRRLRELDWDASTATPDSSGKRSGTSGHRTAPQPTP